MPPTGGTFAANVNLTTEVAAQKGKIVQALFASVVLCVQPKEVRRDAHRAYIHPCMPIRHTPRTCPATFQLLRQRFSGLPIDAPFLQHKQHSSDRAARSEAESKRSRSVVAVR